MQNRHFCALVSCPGQTCISSPLSPAVSADDKLQANQVSCHPSVSTHNFQETTCQIVLRLSKPTKGPSNSSYWNQMHLRRLRISLRSPDAAITTASYSIASSADS